MSTGLDPRDLNQQGQRHFRRNLASQDRETTARLMDAYRDVLKAMDKRLADLMDEAESGSAMALAESRELARLKDDLAEALADFARVVASQAGQMQADGIRQAVGVAENLFRASGITARLNMPGVDEIRQLVNFVDHPEFGRRLAEFGRDHAEHISQIILTDASMGKGAVAAAKHITQYIERMPLAAALRMTRTVQNYAARRGTQQIYLRNSDLLEGWIWGSALDNRVCVSCLVQHGKTFPLTEVLNDHYNGRCAMIPKPRGIPMDFMPGVDWLATQPQAEQVRILGAATYRAWQDRAVRLEELSRTYQDDLYGTMRTAASLRQVLGDGAARYYAD